MIHYVCKVCGRSIRSPEKPSFCYADRTPSIENISDEDAVKMQLFRGGGNEIIMFNGQVHEVEFPGDIVYHPHTGLRFVSTGGYTLSQYQDEIMERVRA